MKKLLGAVMIVLLCAAPAAAGMSRSVLVCDDVVINASSVASGITDCKATDVAGYRWFSFQTTCADGSDTSVNYTVNLVADGGLEATSMAVPVLASGSALAATGAVTAEGWQAIAQAKILYPFAASRMTVRFINGDNDTDHTCSAILIMAE